MKENLSIHLSDRESLNALIELHANTIIIALDDMWENLIIPSGTCYGIKSNNKDIGYFIIGANNYILQIYVIPEYEDYKEHIFDFIIDKQHIKGALAGSFEPIFMALSLNKSTQAEIDTILYKAQDYESLKCPVDDIKHKVASMDDYQDVLHFCKEKVGLEGDWLEPYYQKLIPNESIHLFKLNDTIIGIGEFRPSQSSPDYANLGMMVSKDYRKRYLGSYIMNQMVLLAKQKGLTGICSTTQDNIGSQKAIQKAGLIPYHKILKISF